MKYMFYVTSVTNCTQVFSGAISRLILECGALAPLSSPAAQGRVRKALQRGINKLASSVPGII